MRYLLVLCIVSVCILGSCSNHHIEQFADIEFDKDLEICLVIPEVGCGDCIAGGVYFLNENKDKFRCGQTKNKVVFTAITTLKMLKRGLGEVSLDSIYHEIDTDCNYLLPEPDGLYPVVLYLSSGKIYDIDVQSPDNNIFYKLDTYFANHE